MTTRQDIAAINADAGGDKRGRKAQLKAQRLHEQIVDKLPFTWSPRANVTVIVKQIAIVGGSVEMMVDVTIRGVTKSLSTWIEGNHNPPDFRVTNPPPLVIDPAGDITLTAADGSARKAREDFVAALKQVFIDTFGDKIAHIVRSAR